MINPNTAVGRPLDCNSTRAGQTVFSTLTLGPKYCMCMCSSGKLNTLYTLQGLTEDISEESDRLTFTVGHTSVLGTCWVACEIQKWESYVELGRPIGFLQCLTCKAVGAILYEDKVTDTGIESTIASTCHVNCIKNPSIR